MLRLDLCGYSDAYIVVKGTIDLLAAASNENDKAQKNVIFKNSSPFRSCKTRTNSTFIENAVDLDIVMPVLNLLEYSQHYSMTSGRLWNYYRDEIDDIEDFQMVNPLIIKQNLQENTTKTSTAWKWRRCQSITTITSTSFKCWRHYSTQISQHFLEISWFAIDKLWNRTWFIIDKRLYVDATS